MDPLSALSGPDLAALVGSRLCHDLVSPVGAIGNGLELLQMVSEPSPELALIADAVAAAQARLRLFRLAFGAASADQEVRPADLVESLAALGGNSRIALACDLARPLPRPEARRLALAALCAETACARGGAIRIAPARVEAQGPRLMGDPALWDSLARGLPPPDLAASSVHFALLAASGPVGVRAEEGRLTLTL